MIIATYTKGPLEVKAETPSVKDPRIIIVVTCRLCGLQVSSRTYSVEQLSVALPQMNIEGPVDGRAALEHIERCVGTPHGRNEV